MKKPSTLAEQILQAQRTIDSWPDSRKSSLHLEGSDVFLARISPNHYSKAGQATQASGPKKKAFAG